MVARGQFLERPTLVPVGGSVLEALSHRGERLPAVLFLPPAPSSGGSMDHVVLTEALWATAQSGRPTLRFNHRGVGASQGDVGSAKHWVEDARAALQLLFENTGAVHCALVCVGGSEHTALALARGDARVLGACLVNPGACPPASWGVDRAFDVRCVAGQEDRSVDRAAWQAALDAVSGDLVLVPRADRAFLRNLPDAGKAVVAWLDRLAEPPSAR